MLQKEDLEAVIMAPPLWAHADIAVGCLDAGKHVLCEKMMAWDVPSCERMRDAARKNNKVLEIGYQRLSSPMYQAAYDGILQTGVARRHLSRPTGVAPQRLVAAQGRRARSRLQSLEVGISRLGSPAQLALVLEDTRRG